MKFAVSLSRLAFVLITTSKPVFFFASIFVYRLILRLDQE